MDGCTWGRQENCKQAVREVARDELRGPEDESEAEELLLTSPVL